MSSSASYEQIYGVGLLDDIHNYFPDILYNNSRFNNVRDVLDYVTRTTRRRFDLYSLGRSRYTNESTPELSSASARGSSPVTRSRPTVLAAAATTIEPLTFDIPLTTGPDITDPNINLMNILSSIFAGNPSTLYSTNFMNPVEIRPTSQQIERATHTFNLLVREEDETCPICQEDINVGDRIRKITHCEHTFHIGCIDTWFRRNVHCPVCRFDIREESNNQTASNNTRNNNLRNTRNDSSSEL